MPNRIPASLCCVLLVLAGCQGTISSPDGGSGPADDGGPCTDTWEGYGEAFFAANCTGCHSHDHSSFASQAAVQAELGLISGKVSAGLMPQGAALTPADQARLLAFVACGAPSAPGDAGAPFEAVSPASAVAKVKYLLVGLPPTAAEVQAVTADPAAMSGLVDGWMRLPQYDEKMRVFFELAFQQTQISTANLQDVVPPNSLPGNATPLLVQNMRESFARTVLALNAAGRPFTDVFTTHQLMMTPALMQLYAFLDVRHTDDTAKLNDTWARANPGAKLVLQADGGPVALSDSANDGGAEYLHFYNPSVGSLTRYQEPLCNTDPITLGATSDNLLVSFYGLVPGHQLRGPDGGTLSCTIQNTGNDFFAPTDFTDWRLVTLRRPASGEPVTRFFDLAALRTATELVLATPRVSFFTTPAFCANWPTNQSNQMRVTLNQALIVATGTAVDGLDATATPATPGLDATHAADPACFSCHRILDPARSIFSSTYSWFYTPQADPALVAQKGQFAFQGVTAPVATVDDFGAVLARHPLTPAAWAQKLCTWANSAPCVETDPELKRVVAAFAAGGSWSSLVRALMASPLVTNLAPTITHAARGEVVAVSRRDHLCQALDARLGLSDVCGRTLVRGQRVGLGVVPGIVGGLPSDGYGRGAVAPILPNDPTLFYRAGLENVCAAVAQLVVDAPVSAAQPNARHWSSAQPAAALDDFVTLLLGLPGADPRSAPARALLQAHFTAARQTATASDALRSTFVTACLSPTLIGIGL